VSTIPAKATLRAEQQRARILDAARKCFSERGFQGASIAAIAEAAGMSQGLIYRYFTNKAAIVRAITDSQSVGRRATLEDIHGYDELVDRLLEKIDSWRAGGERDADGFDPSLFLEITSEATRDPDIAQVLAVQEQQVWVDIGDFVRRNARETVLDEAVLQRRTIVLRCLLDGLILCYMRDPLIGREVLRRSLHEALGSLAL
jgi:AcrR family transcriptional regulator